MTDNMKNGQVSEEENYVPKNPDGSFDIRDFLGHGDVYTQWCNRITERDRLIQQERLKTYGKDLPQYLPDGERLTRQGYRMGLRYLTPAERSKGRKPGGRDKAQRLKNKIFDVGEQKRFLVLLEQTGSIVHAAAEAGISRATAYACANRSPLFKQAMEDAKTKHDSKIRRTLTERIQEGEYVTEYDAEGKVVKKTHKPVASALLIKYLESTQKEDFGRKSDVNHLHIGDDSSSNARLSSLCAKLGITMPEDADKKDDENENNILDIN